MKIFEPLAQAAQQTADEAARADIYAGGLACWRARDFAGAITCFARVADVDPPSARFLERAKRMYASPPGPDWTPIHDLEDK